MSDVYIPGIRSPLNSDKIVEDLMKVERIPRDRSEKSVENLQNQKTYWQDVGRLITNLRESARFLYSFQNPFNERSVVSSSNVIAGTVQRGTQTQEQTIVVKQLAAADRFLSNPLSSSFTVEAGQYRFNVGEATISFEFRGGSLQEFVDTLNRRGQDKIHAGLMTTRPGTRSLLIESLVTGADNRLSFEESAVDLAFKTGILGEDSSVQHVELSPAPGAVSAFFTEEIPALNVTARGFASLPFTTPLVPSSTLMLNVELATSEHGSNTAPQVPPGPDIPGAGSASYQGIVILNDLSTIPLPIRTQPEVSQRVDDMQVLSLKFSDGTMVQLPNIHESEDFTPYTYKLADYTKNKTIVAIDITNNNTNRDILIRDVFAADSTTVGGNKALNPISEAQDALISIDGVDVNRTTNKVDDLIPGTTLTLKGTSQTPVRLSIEPNRDQIKDSIITMVGNYNRLMADINVLTRSDEKLIQELSYMSTEEQESMRTRLGVFQGDSTLNQFKSNLQRIVSAPYLTTEGRNLALLAQIGISVDVRGAGIAGYDSSRLRGYLEIDERTLDTALETQLPAIMQLFGYDTDGDRVIDSGVAYSIETITKPFVEMGGIISLKTSTLDSRITQDQRRIQSLDRQLASREATLKTQYSQMEQAFSDMERMTNSLDQFSQQNTNRR
ncbi:MAG: flagellar filament capping protein FliD [Treponema sp.]|jgi:flagellar hook-associated protein 2|nr:flagellar filament capping protein FliD [Treponema sp.]